MSFSHKLLLFFVFISAISCSGDIIPTVCEEDENRSFMTRSEEAPDDPLLSPEQFASDYYDNIATLALATDALCIEGSTFNTDNPFSQKLSSIQFIDEDEDSISFFSLSEDEKIALFNELIAAEKTEMANKIADIPEYADDIILENMAMTDVIEECNLSSGDPDGIRGHSRRGRGSRLNEEEEEEEDDIDPDDEICIIIEKLDSTLHSYLNNSGVAGTVASIIQNWMNNNSVSTNAVLNSWTGYARRGDIVISLPLHNVPWVYINLFNSYLVGHAGVFTQTITATTTVNDNVTIEAWIGDGVIRQTVANWNRRHYVLGLQNVKRKWTWNGVWGHLEPITTPVSNPELLATEAELHIGKNYVTALEFPVAKLVAPSRFTCTSLVWHCAKVRYGIDISNWISPLVSPSAIYTNSHTYIRKTVMP